MRDRTSNGENGIRKEEDELGRWRIELGRRDGAIVMVKIGLRRRRFELGRGRIELGRRDGASNGVNGVKKEEN